MKEGINPQAAMLETLLAVICSDYVFVMLDPSVWFIAQAMCVTLSVAAVYYAVEGRGGLAAGIMGMFGWMQADADRFYTITVISFISEGTYGLPGKKSIGRSGEEFYGLYR